MALLLGVRWVVGDAEAHTIARLVRSIRSARAAFPRGASLAVCVHSIDAAAVRDRIPRALGGPGVAWLQVDRDVPVFVRRRVDLSMAGGAAWRFAPLRVFDDCCEVVLETGFAVGPVAADLLRWARAPVQRRCVVAMDGAAVRVRGVPPSFDFEDALEAVLARGPELLESVNAAAAAELAAISAGLAPIVLAGAPAWRPSPEAHPAISSR